MRMYTFIDERYVFNQTDCGLTTNTGTIKRVKDSVIKIVRKGMYERIKEDKCRKFAPKTSICIVKCFRYRYKSVYRHL